MLLAQLHVQQIILWMEKIAHENADMSRLIRRVIEIERYLFWVSFIPNRLYEFVFFCLFSYRLFLLCVLLPPKRLLLTEIHYYGCKLHFSDHNIDEPDSCRRNSPTKATNTDICAGKYFKHVYKSSVETVQSTCIHSMQTTDVK